MPTPDRNRLKRLADNLQDAAKELQSKAKAFFDAVDDEKDWPAIEKALAAVADSDAAVSAALLASSETLGAGLRSEASSTFAEFLGDVGRAAIETQKRLDVANRAAVASGLAGGGVPLGVFQMPKLHGEVRFALEKTQGEKLGLVFYSRQDQTQSKNEQSMDFDIVSVPPPPELIQSVRSLRPGLSLVLAPHERAQVFSLLDQVETILGKDEKPLAPALLQTHRNLLKAEADAVILIPWTSPTSNAEATQNEEDGYLLLYAAAPADNDWYVGVWQLEPADDPAPAPPPGGAVPPASSRVPRLHVLWKFETQGATSENVQRFKEWVRNLAERQKRFLGQL